jgi:hypothetical protein
MTSFKQIEANRRNALRSTGPITEEGKLQSRCNAVRHGLTAETVIGALEDAEDYKAFEEAITADFDAQSAVERELVLRLASLLWRLRRATAIETGLFEFEAERHGELEASHQISLASRKIMRALFGRHDMDGPLDTDAKPLGVTAKPAANRPRKLTHCFLGLANLPHFALDRLSRYEATLWRQVGQILFTLDVLDRRKLHKRNFRFSW